MENRVILTLTLLLQELQSPQAFFGDAPRLHRFDAPALQQTGLGVPGTSDAWNQDAFQTAFYFRCVKYKIMYFFPIGISALSANNTD